ncbi:hypothetical protein AG4045_026234 [Apium graveolens]|uniref:F-box domain-containing protein n=1 Tax=Apium graveolens TaxID=4045 RepID=A0A6L5BEM7_APIGR|nr:hypothetical protein AG4045_026234 [Apium graveolens]
MNLGSCTNVRRTTELPEEIMNEEILVRLPVEDLLRVRCICKSWESLFFTPDFVQAHFRSTLNKNSVYRDCLVARKSFEFEKEELRKILEFDRINVDQCEDLVVVEADDEGENDVNEENEHSEI